MTRQTPPPPRPPRRLVLGLLLLLASLVLPGTTALAQGDPSFTLVNRSGQPIREVYVSASQDQYWGHDLLQTSVLANGAAMPIRIAPGAGCLQDVRVVYADGRPEERRRQDTCRITQMVFGSAAAVQSGRQANPSFNLVNHGGQPVREVYVSSVRDNAWGEDRLGTEVLPPGRHLAVRLPAGDCVNDVRIVWMDGRSEERRRLDTCRLINLVFR
ncbi:hypothetical protein [Falsiroseomonas selenitidurans]|uniref:Tat pathway signal sequence domain protein n=1 Tax=Falsiroseomonas selenitidurans TaxID=2716335 RepID=A0ABX1E635_9PROT|nr:hypothetical protein [Falsiroseomonas selenitidurans]NKC30997.1 hypothetical protein [Falsiroseomonas selenitidurans]